MHLYLKLFEFRREAVIQEGHTEWLELNTNGQSLCFGYCRTIPDVYAFILANFSATGIDTQFSHPALAGLGDSAITALSTRFPEHPHELHLHDSTLSIRPRPTKECCS